MDPSETYAEQVINRFSKEITKVTWDIIGIIFGGKFIDENGNFDSAYGSDEWKEVEQEIVMCLLSYAGLPVDKPIRPGCLAILDECYRDSDDTTAVAHFIAYDLGLDAKQRLVRAHDVMFETKAKPESIHNGSDDDGTPSDEKIPDRNADTEGHAIGTTRGASQRKLSARFPLLWMREVEGFDNQTIAERLDLPLRTVERRIQLEKIMGQKDPGNTPTSLARGEDVSEDAPFTLGELQRCDLQRNGLGPNKGHCKWCDRAIKDAAITEDDLFRYEYSQRALRPGPNYWKDIGSHGGSVEPCYWRDSGSYREWQLGGTRYDSKYEPIPWHAVERCLNLGRDIIPVRELSFPGMPFHWETPGECLANENARWYPKKEGKENDLH